MPRVDNIVIYYSSSIKYPIESVNIYYMPLLTQSKHITTIIIKIKYNHAHSTNISNSIKFWLTLNSTLYVVKILQYVSPLKTTNVSYY